MKFARCSGFTSIKHQPIWRRLVIHGALFAVALAASSPALSGEEPAPTQAASSSLDQAFAEFEAAIAESAAFIRSHPFYRDPENRAAGYAFLSSMTLKAIEHDIVLDRDFPFFRVLDFRVREGGDNPDQSYFMSPLRGGATYRVWGRRGTERRLDLQTYAGNPYTPGGGRMAGFLDSEKLQTAPDGTFEVIVSPDRREGNWLANPPDGTQILVRQVFSDWAKEIPGEVHIDRVGGEGELKPVLGEEEMTARLRAAAEEVRFHVRQWPAIVERGWTRAPVNTISAPFDPGAQGGVPGRWMARANFELAPDEALVVRTWPMPGNYQGIQLADLWFSSLEYANRQTSLTGDQAVLSADGSYWFVISGVDPGVPNWLDTMGRRRGVALLRFDGLNGLPFDPALQPTARKVKLAELGAILPADTTHVTEAERAAAIAERRRHIQRRLGR